MKKGLNIFPFVIQLRLRSAVVCACIFPLQVVGFGWLSQEIESVSIVVVKLLTGGFLNKYALIKHFLPVRCVETGFH